MGAKRIYCSVYRDNSKKYQRRNTISHDCYRAEIAEWSEGKRIWRKRARFKTQDECWEWLGKQSY